MDGHSGVYFIGLMWSHRKVAASSPRLRICYFAETEKDFISLVIRYGSSFLEVYADFSSEYVNTQLCLAWRCAYWLNQASA
ncbi:hypothetical protein YC2023_070104 [Brassica napus]